MQLQHVHYQKILFATDLSEAARCAFAHAVSLASRYRSTIIVLHVMEDIPDLNTSIIAHIGEAKWNELQERAEIEVRKQLIMKKTDSVIIKEALKQFCEGMRDCLPDGDPVDVQIRVDRGDPCEQILKCAREENCDLIVIGRYGHGRLANLFLGSKAKTLIMQSPVPVLTVGLSESLSA